MLYLVLSLFSAVAQASTPYASELLLSDLPDGARLQVSRSLPLGTLSEDEHQQMLHYCTFENGACTPDYEVGILPSLNSQVNLRTDVEDALTQIGGGYFTAGNYVLDRGIYCLDRSESFFRSGTDDRTDKLRLTDCQGQAVFTLYVRAGYHLRNTDGFRGYSVGDFHFQTGKALLWVR